MAKEIGKTPVKKPIKPGRAKAVKKPVKKRVVKPVEKNHDKDFEYICQEVERGEALRNVCKVFMDTKRFYQLIEESEDKRKRYAHACELRAEAIFEDMLEIADGSNADLSIRDGKLVVDGEAIQRSRLRVETRKWHLSKLAPKKYGDKIDIDHTSNGETLTPTPIVFTRGSNPDDK